MGTWHGAGATRVRASLVRGFLLSALAVVLVTGGCTRRNGPPASGPADWVLYPEEAHYGASYAEWSARWCQWVYETPGTNHPLLDTTGADAARSQVDPVWFIGGVFGSLTVPTTGSATRDITIPSGVALFFPIIEISWDNQICVDPDTTYSFTEMRALAAQTVESSVDLHCAIDGVPVIDAPTFDSAVRYRAQAPEFSSWSPADNLWVSVCGDPPAPVVVDPIAADGIWMMIGPMPPGGHTITFSATTPFPAYFHLDITYHINVLP